MIYGATLSLAFSEESGLRNNDRVIFIGDSITAQGAKAAAGWTPLILDALKKTHPGNKYEFISLGGGGQTLESWQNVELKSRTERTILDVKDVDVKESLDRGADVIVIMLGMNNVLSPRLDDKSEDFIKWAENYRQFIRDLRARAKPRIIAIATPTLCTESEASPKNKVMASLIKQIDEIAKSEGCIVLPTHQAMLWMLKEGRKRDAEFHVTMDFVHPNQAGHVSIASGMLEGLGEKEAAKSLVADWMPKLWNDKEETLSYQVTPESGSESPDSATFRIHYDHRSPGKDGSARIELTLPEGWKIVSAENSGASGFFVVEGKPDRLLNKFTLTAGSKSQIVSIPAPWILGIGNVGGNGWKGIEFDPQEGALALDENFSRGTGFQDVRELGQGKPIVWKRYFAGIGYAGGNAAGALDLAAVAFFQTNDVCYGARWIFSDRERPVSLQVVTLGISGKNFLTVWLNGGKAWSGIIPLQPDSVPVELKKGWNSLVFKSNHRQWRWQFSIDLVPQKADDLGDLRVRTQRAQ